jgi:hypothetical protein
VNDPPSAQDDFYALPGSSLTVPVGSGVLANDSDVDSVGLTASVVQAPAHGALTLNANGSFHLHPHGGLQRLGRLPLSRERRTNQFRGAA